MTPEEMLYPPLGPETMPMSFQSVTNKYGPLDLKWLPLPKSEYPVE